MRKKNYFCGKYFKHVSPNGDVLSIIVAKSSLDGDILQVVFDGCSYQLTNTSSVRVGKWGISFDVNEKDINIHGHITYGQLHKPKKHIMSFFRFLPIECKHDVYSMYHTLNGSISINEKEIDFQDGIGYIEGDKGRSFPSKYLWINSSKYEDAFVLAIADIPLFGFHILGMTALLSFNNKEYRFGTYNFAKAICYKEDKIMIKQGSYTFRIDIIHKKGAPLRAPISGKMSRTIHECLQTESHFVLYKRNKVIHEGFSDITSYEYVMDE